MLDEITGLMAVFLCLGTPVVVMMMYYKEKMSSKAADMELRKTVIESGVDAETAKVIISENAPQRKKHSKFAWIFATLIVGCALVGSGAGSFIGREIGSGKDSFFLAVAGCGIGLIAAFVATWKMYPKLKNSNIEESPKDEQ